MRMFMVGVMALTASPALSGDIEKACLAADRSAATPTLCRCIQTVADQNLSRSDQREAAKFFEEPHLAQETRQSDNPSKEKFWLRYKDWKNQSAKMCG